MTGSMIERLVAYVEREIDTSEMVLTDPIRLRRMKARRVLRAVLSTLQDPDNGVIGAINDTFDPDYGEFGASCHITSGAWQAAISHILKESESAA